jgi:hypothetical protein
VPLKASKETLKESDPKWRGYLLGVWQRRQKSHPEIRELYNSKLILAQQLLQQWVATHPDAKVPVTLRPLVRTASVLPFSRSNFEAALCGDPGWHRQGKFENGSNNRGRLCGAAQIRTSGRGSTRRQAGLSADHHFIQGRVRTKFQYCNTPHSHNMGKHRLVINYRQADLSDTPTFSSAIVWCGKRQGSRAFAGIAGPFKSITRKAMALHSPCFAEVG